MSPADGKQATRFEPPVMEEAEAFWEASKQKQLVLPWCVDCDKPFWYPRPVCPRCLSPNVEWRPSEGKGQVYAVSVMHRPGNPMMADRVPYAVVLVDLDDGVRMMSNAVGVDAVDVRIGMPVTVTWEELTDGRNLPLFEVTGAPPG